LSEFQGVLSKAHWHVPPQTTKCLIGSHVSSVDLSRPFCCCLWTGHVHRCPGQRVRRGGCQQRRRVRHLLWRWRAATRSHGSGTTSAQGLLSRPARAGVLMPDRQYSVTWQEPHGLRAKNGVLSFHAISSFTMIRSALLFASMAAGLAACSTTSPATSADGNAVGGFPTEQAERLSAGAWAGPPPGQTPAERKARQQYYKGPRANEWL